MHPALRKNIRLYGWYKIFNKRVFVPVTAIYLIEVGHLTLTQLGTTATITALITLAAQIPTGYIADRYSRRSAMMIGSAILALGVSVLVFWPSFIGSLVAGTLSGIGFAFVSGAGQALIHDSLEHWGNINQYVKVMGRAQSKGLIGNIILVGVVPMTYSFDKRMPFILGVAAFLILFGISWALVEPTIPKVTTAVDKHHVQNIIQGTRAFLTKRTVWFFAALGLAYGLYSAPTDFSNLILKDLGVAPSHIGWVFSGASVLGALGGYGIHHLEKLSFKAFIYIDLFVCCAFFAVIGLTHNVIVAVVASLINLSFWRLRSIIYQHHLLRIFKGSKKAMLISLLGFGEQLFVIVLPLMFAFSITHMGYYRTYTIIGFVTALILYAMLPWGLTRLPLEPEAKPVVR